MMHTYFSYLIIELYCIGFTLTILFKMNQNMGSEHEVAELRNMIISFLVMLVTDCIWALMEDSVLKLPDLLNLAINACTVLGVAYGCFFWFRFIDDRLHPSYTSWKWYNTIVKIPIMFITVLDVISIFTGWLFYLDENKHYQSGEWFNLQTTVNYVYLLVPTINSVIKAIKANSRSQRQECLTYALYMVAPLIAGLCEDLIPTIPILALNIYLVINLLFITIQNLQIYNDALTGLNNRRRLDQFIEDQLRSASKEKNIILFMLDINNFKTINDTYGHIEGDKTLKGFASILMSFALKHGAFTARYGGDEFCLIMEKTGRKPEELLGEIQEALHAIQWRKTANENMYQLTASIGYAVCEKPTTNVRAFIEEADSMLYANKQRWHEQNDKA